MKTLIPAKPGYPQNTINMFKLKELFILFFILISCLIINFNNNSSTNDFEKTTETQIQKNELQSLFINETQLLIKQPENTESTPSTISNENINPQEISLEENLIQNTTALSLETVLTEIKNMSLKIKSEVEKNTDNREKEINIVLKDYLLSIGYSSWKEYSLSEDYRLAREWFLINQDSFKEEFENALPLCTTILAVGAGGACSCDYAAGTCYQDTPAGRYYHCLGACCCACCPICCGGI